MNQDHRRDGKRTTTTFADPGPHPNMARDSIIRSDPLPDGIEARAYQVAP